MRATIRTGTATGPKARSRFASGRTSRMTCARRSPARTRGASTSSACRIALMDWEAWARTAEQALDVTGRGDWKALFAPDATFGDPHTPSTKDLRSISRQTRQIFPDWTQEITRIRGTETWAVFEWIGRGTF